jgi:hypothetical protein
MAVAIPFILMTVAQIGISYLFPAEGPRLKDLKISASTYGAAIPGAFGYTRVAGNMIWAEPIKEHKRKKTAGKGGTYNEYKYTCTFAMALCEGPIQSVQRIWADNKLIYDMTGASQVKSDTKFQYRTYTGTEEQLPDSAYVRLVGEANATAHRGLAYIVFQDMPLEDFGNRIPQIAAEVFASGDVQVVAQSQVLTTYQPGRTLLAGTLQIDDAHDAILVSSNGGVRRFSLSDGSENFFFPVDGLTSIAGISPLTGNVVLSAGDANSPYLSLNEPFGLGEIGRVYGPGGTGSIIPILTAHGDFATDLTGSEYFAAVTLLGNMLVMPTFPNFGAYTALGQVDYGVYDTRAVCGSKNTQYPTFYFWMGAASSGQYITAARLVRVRSEDRGASWITSEVFSRDNPAADSPTIHIDFAANWCIYDETDGGILLQWRELNQDWLGKWDPNLGTLRWAKVIPFFGISDVQQARILYGQLMWSSGHTAYLIDTVSGNYVQSLSGHYDEYSELTDIPADTASNDPNASYSGFPVEGSNISGPQAFDSIRGVLVVGDRLFSNGVILHQGSQVETGSTTLQALVETLMRRGGLTGAYFDMTRLSGVHVTGYGWAGVTNLKALLDQLRQVYLFDIVESDGRLTGVLRGDTTNDDRPGKPNRTIPQILLGSSAPDATDYWQETRTSEAELPAKVSLAYMNATDDYGTSTAVAKRLNDPDPTMYSLQQVAIETTLVMAPVDAKNQVNKILYSQWAERAKHNTRLPWAYLDLDPADVVKVNMQDGRSYTDRINTLEFGADFAIGVTAYAQDPQAYISEAVADGGGVPSFGIQAPRPARPFIFNTPLFRDSDDSSGAYSLYYTGVGAGVEQPFKGATLFRSENNSDYSPLYQSADSLEWGQVTQKLGSPSHGAFALDWVNKVVIWPAVKDFELEPITDDELWAGGNMAVIGDEIIQFRDAVQNDDGSWTISNLLRGRRGTEYACDHHLIGESFVMLSSSTIVAEGETIDARTRQRWFKSVGTGRSLVDAPALPITYEPRDLMPYAPKDIRRTVSGSTLTVTWKRRTRTGGNMQDFTPTVPLNEAIERYEVYILSSPFTGDLTRSDSLPDGILLARTVDSPTLTVDVSEIASSFDVDIDNLHVLIYQISAAVGRGFPGVRTIEPWRAF